MGVNQQIYPAHAGINQGPVAKNLSDEESTPHTRG